jgi:deferrochelatase/peroxidase EfeB
MAVADLSGADGSPSAKFADIQALLRSGLGSLSQACFLLLRVTDAESARAWLAAAPVTPAGSLARHVPSALQLAFTAHGLRNLGLPEQMIARFSEPFLSGIAGDDGRSRRLGDVGVNAPSRWRWGGEEPPDVLVMLYAAAGLAGWREEVEGASFHKGFSVLEELPTADMGAREPFGFVDGVSQPRIDWAGRRTPGEAADLDYGNLISSGEFLLGYRNEYGLYTERPLLEPALDPVGILPRAEEDSGKCDLGRNGTYLVLRELHQDVRGFWRFLSAQSHGAGSMVNLAEAMLGRSMSGDPLMPLSQQPIPGVGPDAADIARNQFTYDSDRQGVRCPIGAHVRRANPRTGDMPGGRQGPLAWLLRTLGFGRPNLQEDLVAATRFHRILRRGREFGSFLPYAQALDDAAPDPHAGLHFICLNANIARQFEFVQNAWLSSAKFAGLSGESDPVTGNREPFPPGQSTDGFSRPQREGPATRIAGIPPFVTVRGGGYFFMPGLRALRYIAAGPPP